MSSFAGGVSAKEKSAANTCGSLLRKNSVYSRWSPSYTVITCRYRSWTTSTRAECTFLDSRKARSMSGCSVVAKSRFRSCSLASVAGSWRMGRVRLSACGMWASPGSPAPRLTARSPRDYATAARPLTTTLRLNRGEALPSAEVAGPATHCSAARRADGRGGLCGSGRAPGRPELILQRIGHMPTLYFARTRTATPSWSPVVTAGSPRMALSRGTNPPTLNGVATSSLCLKSSRARLNEA